MTYAARLAAGLLAVVLLAGCAEAATAQPTPTPQASPIPTSKPASLQLSDAMLTAPDSQPFFVFQAAGDARLRGVTWDGSVNGLFTRSGPLGLYGQSPDGRYVVLNGSIYNRHGQAIGPFPWPGKDLSAAWSPDSATMCRAYSPTQITGSALQLDDALPGHTPTTVARGFATFFDQSSYPVLACDPRAGRAVIAQFDPTGSAALRVWVIRLTDGTVVRSISAPGGWVAASGDAALLARTLPSSSGHMPRTTIERTDDGATLGSVDDLDVRGFSGDGSMLVGLSGSARTPVLIDWRGGRRVWSAERGMYMGYLSEPGGGHVVVGLVSADGYLGDAYLVGPEGASVRLPERISAGLH